MKSSFKEYFRPSNEELNELWNNSTFIVDANVLLNLYRYSEETKKELENAINQIKDKIFITHQAAKEFFQNRLDVSSNPVKEYKDTISEIEKLKAKLSSKNKHPVLPEDKISNFKTYLDELVKTLDEQQKSLDNRLTDDKILLFIRELFDKKTGEPFNENELKGISEEGERRYENKIPPGFKDDKKNSGNDLYRKYGDLIMWKQIIKFSKEQNKSVIFITDDKKEGWWLEHSGKTISPRPEIIKEFYNETEREFWMYTVDGFLRQSAEKSQSTISDNVYEEIAEIGSELKISHEVIGEKQDNSDIFSEAVLLNEDFNAHNLPSAIDVSQSELEFLPDRRKGLIIIKLNKAMKYATGTGKFSPYLSAVPDYFNVTLVSSPYGNDDAITIRYGCGTKKDFNIHLKPKRDFLEAGEYIFQYKAACFFED